MSFESTERNNQVREQGYRNGWKDGYSTGYDAAWKEVKELEAADKEAEEAQRLKLLGKETDDSTS